MSRVIELKDEQSRLVSEARALLDKADAEKRDLTTEEAARHKALLDEADAKYALANRMVEQERREKQKLEAEERERLEAARAKKIGSPEQRKKEYARVFDKWMRGGVGGLDYNERSVLQRGQMQFSGDDLQSLISAAAPEDALIARALTTTAGGSGANIVPEDFRAEIEKAMLAFNGIMRAPTRKITTGNGRDLPWPTVDDTGNTGELLATEGTSTVSEQDVTIGQVTLNAYTYSSKMVRVQWQLLQDSAFDVAGFLAPILGERLGRITASHFVTGTGTGQPNGIVTAAPAGTTAPSAAAGITFANWIDMIHEIDEAYRQSPNFHLLFNDATLAQARKLTDDQSNPIWNMGVAGQAPASIGGVPYTVVSQMAGPGASTNKAVICGDLSRYVIRQVRDMFMVRLDERYAEYLQSAFFVWARFDADSIDAGTAFQHYAMIA